MDSHLRALPRDFGGSSYKLQESEKEVAKLTSELEHFKEHSASLLHEITIEVEDFRYQTGLQFDKNKLHVQQMQAKIDIHEAENNILKKSLQDRDMRIQTLEKCINEYAGKGKDLQNSLKEANKRHEAIQRQALNVGR